MCVCNQANLTDTLATLFITGRHRYDLYRDTALSRVQVNTWKTWQTPYFTIFYLDWVIVTMLVYRPTKIEETKWQVSNI